MSGVVVDYRVELPAGGNLHLQTPEEVQLWEQALARYRDEYVLTKVNDLVSLGALLQQQVIIYRCQVAVNGMKPQVDAQGLPTGSYERIDYDAADLAGYQRTLIEATKEMRALEKQLGIDKSTREQGGAHTLDNYLRTLKRAANRRGIHIVKSVTEYQGVFKELSWKLRLLYEGDAQDRAYHNVTPKSVLDWLRGEIARLEQLDKDFSEEYGRLYAGQL